LENQGINAATEIHDFITNATATATATATTRTYLRI
jgi:hypothetical protein